MLMVVFGAGASYDSSSTYPPGATISVTGESAEFARLNEYHRLPLAKDLFANRPTFINAIDEFPQCKPVVSRLRDPAVTSGRASVEARLREIEEEAKTYVRGKQELAAIRCYLTRVISVCEAHWRNNTRGITNHLSLLREIRRTHTTDEPVCLVTFNYDTLLENALVELDPQFEIKRMEDYTRRPALFRLFKLHGSVNWGREVDISGFPANLNMTNPPSVLKYLIENATEQQITDRFAICHPSSMGLADGRVPVFPAIAIPVEKKSMFECPNYMIEELKSVLPHITEMILIGWRATEEHFLELLKQHLKPGVYISIVSAHGPEAQEVGVHISQFLLNNRPSLYPEQINGFTQFILGRRAEAILRGLRAPDENPGDSPRTGESSTRGIRWG
jgi:SIR2-like domain